MSISSRPCGRSAARGITRVFSEGGPRSRRRLIALELADEVALITAEKPLGRPGVPALDAQARAALLDGSRYCAVETLDYGPDTMRLWQRADGSGGRTARARATCSSSAQREPNPAVERIASIF